jgi:prolycopene isomerase
VTGDEEGARGARGVLLANGKLIRGRTVISNATRWDTFEKLLPRDELPAPEKTFLKKFKKSPSFFTMHLGVKAELLPDDCQCHHIILEDWTRLEDAHGTLFVSIPTVLDPSLSPDGTHIIHAFTPDYLDNWKCGTPQEYEAQKERQATAFLDRLEAVFPGLKEAIVLKEVATPRTQRRFLNRSDGTYGPIPRFAPLGMLSMPLNTTAVEGLYCTGDSTFPGQGVNAVVFSGFGCAHRVLCDLGMEKTWPLLDAGLNKMLSFLRQR